MRKVIKRTLAVFLALVMVSSSFMCFATELNQDAVNRHYGQFKNYLLLGDSVASGYRDEISDNDADFNEANNESTYYRVPGSYADVLANAIIEDKGMTAYAGPGFRTIEMRYMLEDDFAATCEDEYLFWPSHLYVYEDQLAPDGSGEYLLPGAEYFRKDFQKSVAEADLITLGVGGNDWGAYLGWVVNQIFEKKNIADKYVEMLQDFMASNDMDISTIAGLVDIAHIAGALPELINEVPAALSYGLGNFYSNWDIMIQDIYDLNPDVTLVVLGMSDNSLKGKYYDYDGVIGEPVNGGAEEDPLKAQLMTTIIDFIMTVGNKPMVDGAETFGYTYVDTAGTTYVDSHPDAAGHVFIANKIIEALPDPEVSTMFEDIKPGHKYYNDVEYVIKNGIMSGLDENTFGPDAALTTGQLAAALNAMIGTENPTNGSEEVEVLRFAITFFTAGAKKGLSGFVNSIKLSLKIMSDNGFRLGKTVTRAEAASYFRDFDK